MAAYQFKYHFRLSPMFVAVVAQRSRYRIRGRRVIRSCLLPLKTHHIGVRCTLNMPRAQTSTHGCGVKARSGRYQLKCRPHHLTMVQNYEVRCQKLSSS
ncbi:hypothetical protein TNCV_1296081 [Trichonephila clavipes]|uniref:Uncharacterized protein n=1 Tax=Trichonephila clavipes TaxID=2585209 RepID=A0A8X6SRK4_TRICX|nr:hypothetical protein TNCV_1296081 [Trichonephila clavipes]